MSKEADREHNAPHPKKQEQTPNAKPSNEGAAPKGVFKGSANHQRKEQK